MTSTQVFPALTFAGLRRGALLSLPFSVSSIVYGVAFGLLATGASLTTVQAVAMSALIFSGSAQVPVVQAWAEHPTLAAVFVTVLVANVRYLLMSAALRSWLAPLGAWRAIIVLLPLVDGSFALAYRQRDKGDHDVGVLLGSCLMSYGGWIIGTGFGTIAGRLIANPRAIGLDFIIVAFCAAFASTLARSRADLLPGLAAVAAVAACEWLAPGPWTVAAAAVSAALVGALTLRSAEPKP